MKPFKTDNQQLSLLRSRGMELVNGSAANRVLENEGYTYVAMDGAVMEMLATIFIE